MPGVSFWAKLNVTTGRQGLRAEEAPIKFDLRFRAVHMSTDYAIFNAAEKNDSRALKKLLDSGIDPNVRDYDRGATPLHLAANKGHVEAIEILIDAGADVNATNNRGRTPIHSLMEMRFYKIVLWLIKYCGGDAFREDSRGLTPYDLAQGFMQKEIDGTFMPNSHQISLIQARKGGC